MDDTRRTTASYLAILQDKELYRYSFYKVMRLIECAYQNRPRFGQSKRPVDEAPIRLGQEISLAFAPSSLVPVKLAEIRKVKNLPPILRQYIIGLSGSNGVLPLHLTDYVLERMNHHRDYTIAGFLDMFHHRMISLFYRAWANNEPTVSLDRPEHDYFANYVGSLTGVGTAAFSKRDAMPDLAKRHYVGYLSQQTKHAEGLRAIVADYFGLTIRIEQFVGEWLSIQHNDLTRLGHFTKTNELGQSAILGSTVWCCQHKFRIYFSHLSLTQYLSLLPNGKLIEQLTALIRNYVGDELVWDMNLILQKQHVPSLQLGQAQLGWTTWLGKRQSDQDANDLILNPFFDIT